MSTADKPAGYFLLLTREEQVEAIRRMAASGMTDHTIAAATMLSVEQIRAILGERTASESPIQRGSTDA
jgi:hypothetical protein